MKLTEEQAIDIVAKVYKDLKIECDDRCSIKVHFHSKEDKKNRHKKDYWSGYYDYSKPPLGIKIDRTYPYDPISIDDEKGIAIYILFPFGDNPIELDKNGNYIWGKG